MTRVRAIAWPRTITVLLLAGCQAALGPGTGPIGSNPPSSEVDAGVTAPAVDAGFTEAPPGEGGGDGGGGEDGMPEVYTRGAIRSETCGNGFDDDDNGIIDDGCGCAVGTERPCWLGPPDARGVGACHDGVQRCVSDGENATWSYCEEQRTPGPEVRDNGLDDDCDGSVDEPDGICVATANEETGAAACTNGLDDDCDTVSDCDDPDCAGMAHCPGGCDATESLCWGGVDDDCDGRLDCDDPDCAGAPTCATGPCGPDATPVYRQRDLGASWGPSYIAPGDGSPIMPMTCETELCPLGKVGLVRLGFPMLCVPGPPDCEEGTQPNYVGSGWRCDRPCDLLIHYGSIYGGQNVCAPQPDLSCPSGDVPTFVYETRQWSCRPICDNGLYDQIVLDGRTVCVPC